MASQSSTNMPGSPKICNMYVASDPEDTDVLSEVVEDESTWTDATPNAENQVEDISVEFCDDDPTIMSFSNGKQYHIDYAVQKYCNDGRTTMSGQSRVSRFQVVPSSKLTLKAKCPRGSSGCLVMYIGAVGTFGVTTKGRFGKKRKENKKGKILFIARAESDTKSVYRSSVNYRPLNTACSIHNQLAMFVKGECGPGGSGTKLQTQGRWVGQFLAGMQFSTKVLKCVVIC